MKRLANRFFPSLKRRGGATAPGWSARPKSFADRTTPALSLAVLLLLVASGLSAQVSNQRLLRATDEPHNWMTYSGSYMSQRYSTLNQINLANVKNLEQKWIFQA